MRLCVVRSCDAWVDCDSVAENADKRSKPDRRRQGGMAKRRRSGEFKVNVAVLWANKDLKKKPPRTSGQLKANRATVGETISMDAGHGAQESSASCSLRAGPWVEFFLGVGEPKRGCKYFKEVVQLHIPLPTFVTKEADRVESVRLSRHY